MRGRARSGGTGTLLRRSARLRLALSFLVLLLIGATASILAVRALLHHQLDARISLDLHHEIYEFERMLQRLEAEEDAIEVGDGLGGLFDAFLQIDPPAGNEQLVTLVDGRTYRSAGVESSGYDLGTDQRLLQQVTSASGQVDGTLDTRAGPVRFVAQPVALADEQGHLIAAAFVAEDEADIESMIRISTAVILLFLIIGALFTFVVAGRVFAPIEDLTATARRITETDLSQRIEITGSDEVAELEHTFNEMLDRLDKAFTTQRQLLRDVGHELRTPLAIASGHLEFVPESEDSAEALAVVREEHDRMRRLIEDLLVLARAERQDFLVLETVDLSLLVTGLHERARHLADRDWQLITEYVPKVVADPQRISQAMVNLIDNAIKHTAPGDRIEIGVQGDKDTAVLWVEDCGPGVREDERDQIFELFVRGSDAPRGTGSGLGLAIVRHITQAHSGTVAVESTPRGARFIITIPVDQPEPAEEL